MTQHQEARARCWFIVKIVMPRVRCEGKESIARCPQSDGLCHHACFPITRVPKCGLTSWFGGVETLRTPCYRRTSHQLWLTDALVYSCELRVTHARPVSFTFGARDDAGLPTGLRIYIQLRTLSICFLPTLGQRALGASCPRNCRGWIWPTLQIRSFPGRKFSLCTGLNAVSRRVSASQPLTQSGH